MKLFNRLRCTSLLRWIYGALKSFWTRREDDTSPMVLLGRSAETVGQTSSRLAARTMAPFSPSTGRERERERPRRGGRGEEQRPD